MRRAPAFMFLLKDDAQRERVVVCEFPLVHQRYPDRRTGADLSQFGPGRTSQDDSGYLQSTFQLALGLAETNRCSGICTSLRPRPSTCPLPIPRTRSLAQCLWAIPKSPVLNRLGIHLYLAADFGISVLTTIGYRHLRYTSPEDRPGCTAPKPRYPQGVPCIKKNSSIHETGTCT
jgi:hypothetical protein